MASFRHLLWKVVHPLPAFSAVPAVCFISKVKAEEPVVKEECCHCKTKKLLKATELPLYGDPDDCIQYELEERAPGSLELGISTLRKTASQYLYTVEETKERASQIYETAIAHSKGTYDYITHDDNAIPRAIVITVGGLGGLLLGARGGLMKKITYSGTGMLVVASLCYPRQAIELTQRGYKVVRDQSVSMVKEYTVSKRIHLYGYDLKDLFSLKNFTSTQLPTPTIDEIGQQGEEKQSNEVTNTKDKNVQGDPGMSNPEDKDMYTTRGS
ncbi:MICOS complex subunit MIC27-like isoform X3 [Limulus polyphemus]|uniref:MICOS complex subunit n=1 Tax=Limulus polyphemus TaxID=6850 RepID=A0ABM1TRP7_LIMPO|nr:MICOS complex subunit MIC27-like isoform X3 [Limulus polyphemus]